MSEGLVSIETLQDRLDTRRYDTTAAFDAALDAYREELDDDDYVVAYHGTSHRLREAIMEHGLRPRTDTDMPAVDPAKPSHDDTVYFSAKDMMARQRAETGSVFQSTVDILGGRPMLVEAALRVGDLVGDEDFSDDPYESIGIAGSVGHKGTVYPSREAAPDDASYIRDIDIGDDLLAPEDVRREFARREVAARDEGGEEPSAVKAAYRDALEEYDTQLTPVEAAELLAEHE